MSDERQEPTPETQPTPEAQPTSPSASAHPSAAIVDEWFQGHIVGSAIGRSTEAWNHLSSKIAVLKTMLAKAL